MPCEKGSAKIIGINQFEAYLGLVHRNGLLFAGYLREFGGL